MLSEILSKGWKEFYETIKNNPEIEKLETQLDKCYGSTVIDGIEPHDKNDLLKSLRLVPFECVKVVILGNKPLEKSNGLTFGSYGKTKEFDKIKDELLNEFEEISQETSEQFTNRLASQGVLLLDTCPTSLMRGKTNIHSLLWTTFMEELVKYIYERGHIVWLIWSQSGLKLINSVTDADKDNGGNKKSDNDKRNVPTNILLKCSYPTQTKQKKADANTIYTKKFEGCNHFIICNNYLKQMFYEPIEWLPKTA